MDWIESKYISLLSGRLRNFKRKSNKLINFSCIFCGDSKTNLHKARGYILEKKGKSIYYCHNCGRTSSVGNFIKEVDPLLYKEFLLERLKDSKNPQQQNLESFSEKMKKPNFIKESVLASLQKISQLDVTDPLKIYIEKRKIPSSQHYMLFKCPKFMEFTNKIVPQKFSDEALKYDETRLLIPFFNQNKELIAYQCRSLKNNLKYIFIVLDNEQAVLFGLNNVNLNKRFYVFEGPIDSMFVPNSLASGGGDIVSTLSKLTFIQRNCTIVYDNEPRNLETVRKIEKAINYGYNVCIFPEKIIEKDINDMILSGKSSEEIKYIIDSNTFSDLKAKLALQQWRKL